MLSSLTFFDFRNRVCAWLIDPLAPGAKELLAENLVEDLEDGRLRITPKDPTAHVMLWSKIALQAQCNQIKGTVGLRMRLLGAPD
jgi:hypothetical protein